MITSPDEIADTFADHYANMSRDLYKKSKPGKKRKKKEELPYNKPFTDRELKAAIKQQKNTALRKDTIHPQMIKRLPLETLKYLLDMYNQIWENGEILNKWETCYNNAPAKRGKRPK